MTAPAVTAVTTAEAAQYGLEAATAARAAQLAIRAAAMRDAVRLWPLLDKSRLSETFPGWLRAMTLLVARYHGQSSTVAATFYRSARAQALQSPTPTSLIKLAPEPAPEWLSRAFGFSGPGMLSRDTAQPGTALSTTLGTTARVVLDGGRTTTLDTVRADPAAIGWFRVTDGDPCAFCALLASRGVVYKKDTVDFKAHNDCGCSGAPAFSRDQALPDISSEAAAVYANRGRGDAMTAFRKAWSERGRGEQSSAPAGRRQVAPKAAAPKGRSPEQVRSELAALEKNLPNLTTDQQRQWTRERIATLRALLGQ